MNFRNNAAIEQLQNSIFKVNKFTAESFSFFDHHLTFGHQILKIIIHFTD